MDGEGVHAKTQPKTPQRATLNCFWTLRAVSQSFGAVELLPSPFLLLGRRVAERSSKPSFCTWPLACLERKRSLRFYENRCSLFGVTVYFRNCVQIQKRIVSSALISFYV